MCMNSRAGLKVSAHASMKMAIIEKGDQPLPASDDKPLIIDSEPLRPEPRGFAPDEMVRCETCLRANPPTRTSCLYCAAQLPVSEASAALQKPTLRRLERWEQGFNVVLMPDQKARLTEEKLQEMAQLLRLGTEDLGRIVDAGEPLPIARASTPDEASLTERKLREMGVKALVVADRELDPEGSAPNRVRALEMTESAIVLYQTSGQKAWRVPWADVVLLVAGRIFVREVEVEERKGRRAEKEIVDAREMNTDEAVLDIYAAEGTTVWRIAASNFDFSCLGSRKSWVAAQNFSTLVELLKARAQESFYDDSYNRVRHELAAAWPLEQKTESRGWRRKRPGSVSTEAVTRSDNESQFTRYSHLKRYLQVHQPVLNA